MLSECIPFSNSKVYEAVFATSDVKYPGIVNVEFIRDILEDSGDNQTL